MIRMEYFKVREPRIKIDNSVPDDEIRFNGTFEDTYKTFFINEKNFAKILKDLAKILREETQMATKKKAVAKKKTAKKGKK